MTFAHMPLLSAKCWLILFAKIRSMLCCFPWWRMGSSSPWWQVCNHYFCYHSTSVPLPFNNDFDLNASLHTGNCLSFLYFRVLYLNWRGLPSWAKDTFLGIGRMKIPFLLFINILIAEVYAIIFGLLTFACINLMDFLFSIFSQLL